MKASRSTEPSIAIGNTVTARRSESTRRAASARGFTLIEIMIVVSLVILLSAIAFATYKDSVQRGREAVLHEDLFRLRDAIDQFYADKSKYPADLEELASSGYIRRIPVDPMTNSSSTWVTEQAEPDPNNPTAQIGIFNVKSGAEGTGIDGSNYSDW
jgi:general secretion pathway protein G